MLLIASALRAFTIKWKRRQLEHLGFGTSRITDCGPCPLRLERRHPSCRVNTPPPLVGNSLVSDECPSPVNGEEPKNARFAAGIFHITVGAVKMASLTCSSPNASFFDGTRDSNSHPPQRQFSTGSGLTVIHLSGGSLSGQFLMN